MSKIVPLKMADEQGIQAGAVGTDAIGRGIATSLVNGISSHKWAVASMAGQLAQVAIDKLKSVPELTKLANQFHTQEYCRIAGTKHRQEKETTND